MPTQMEQDAQKALGEHFKPAASTPPEKTNASGPVGFAGVDMYMSAVQKGASPELAAERMKSFSAQTKSGVDPTKARAQAESTAGVLSATPKPTMWEDAKKAIAEIPVGPTKTVGDVGDELKKIYGGVKDFATSNMLGATDEEYADIQKRQNAALDKFFGKTNPTDSWVKRSGVGAAKAVPGVVEGFLSPSQMALMIGTMGGSSLEQAAAKLGIRGAVPAAKTISKLVQAHFAASMIEGAASSIEGATRSAVNGDWEAAGGMAVQGLADGIMAKGLISHEEAVSKVRSDLEKKARQKFGEPEGSTLAGAFKSRFESLDPYKQAEVIHDTVQGSQEYQDVLKSINDKDESVKAQDKTKKQERKLAGYRERAIQQSWHPDAVERAMTQVVADREEIRQKEEADGLEKSRQHYLKQITASIKAATERTKAAEEVRKAEERGERPARKAEEAAARVATVAGKELIAGARDAASVQRQRNESAVQERTAGAVPQRSVDVRVDESGHASYGATYFGEDSSFGVAGNGSDIGVYRQTPRGIEYLDENGFYSDSPESLYTPPDHETAETVAKLSALRHDAENTAEAEGATEAQKKDAAFLADLESKLVTGEIRESEARKQAGLAEKAELPTEFDAARSGKLNGPLHDRTAAEYVQSLRDEMEAAGYTEEEMDALAAEAQTLARSQTESNLHHVSRSGDYIVSGKGVTWTLDSKGKLHPDDGSAPVALMKNGRYSNQAMQLAQSGRVGYGGMSREQRRAETARQRVIKEKVGLIKDELNEALAHVDRVAAQQQGLESTPEDLPREDEAEKSRRRSLFDKPGKEVPTTTRQINAIAKQVKSAAPAAWDKLEGIAAFEGVDPDEVLRQVIATQSTPEGKIAGLEAGDKIEDGIRKDRTWVVSQRPDGKYELVSNGGARLDLDRIDPSVQILELAKRGEVISNRPSDDGVKIVKFEAPHVITQGKRVETVKEIAAKAPPEPATPAVAEVEAKAAEKRTEAAQSAAVADVVEARDPSPEVTLAEADQNVDKAEESIKLAETAYAQQAKAESKTVPNEKFPERAPVSVGLVGNKITLRQNQQEFPAHYEAVPIQALQISHKWEGNRQVPSEDYPSDLQPRTISEDESKQNVMRATPRILNPEADTAYSFDEYADKTINGSMGPSIVDRGGRVVGGNTRLGIMIKHLELLKGIEDPEMRAAAIDGFWSRMNQLGREVGIQGMTQDGRDAIVVRVMDEPIETTQRAVELGKLFNKKIGVEINQDVMAVSYGKLLTDDILTEIAQKVDAHDGVRPAMQADPDFFKNIVDKFFGIGAEEHQSWYEKDAMGTQRLHDDGKAMFEKALLGTVIRDTAVLDKIKNTPPHRALGRAIANLLKLRSLPDRNIIGKVNEAVAALAETRDVDPQMSLKNDKWYAAYQKDQVELGGMETEQPDMPDRIVEAIWRALNEKQSAKSATPTYFNRVLDKFLGDQSLAAGNLFGGGEDLQRPVDYFNSAFATELEDIRKFRGDATKGISESEFQQALNNQEMTDVEREDALKEESEQKPHVDTIRAINAAADAAKAPKAMPDLKDVAPKAEDVLPFGWKSGRLVEVEVGDARLAHENAGEAIPDPDKVHNYSRRSTPAPPLEAVYDQGKVVLTDGMHRLAAAKAKGEKTVRVWIDERSAQTLERPKLESTPESEIKTAKAEKGYVTPEELKTFLQGHDATKGSVAEQMRTAQIMAEYVFDLDPPEGVDRKDALAWALRERVAKLGVGDKNVRGSFTPVEGEGLFGKGILELHKAADETTFIHEFAHAIFPLLSEQDMRDLNTLEGEKKRNKESKYPAWDGNRATLKGETFKGVSEKFTGGLEKFLRDENPTGFTAEVKKVLEKVKEIFRAAYLRFASDPLSPFKLTDEARRVFGDMFGVTDFDIPDTWKEEVKKARASDSKKGFAKPTDEPHPIQKLAKQYGAAGIRKAITGEVVDSEGDRVDPTKPNIVLTYPDTESAIAAYIEASAEGSNIKGVELIDGKDGTKAIRFNVDKPIPNDVLYQDVPRKHPGVELEELEAKFKAATQPMLKKLLEIKIQNLKNEVRAKYGTESLERVAAPEAAKAALEEVKNARTDKLRGLFDEGTRPGLPAKTGGISKPAFVGMPGHGTAGPRDTGKGGANLPRPTTALSGVRPVALEPTAERAAPVGLLVGDKFNAKAWAEGLEKAGLPDNSPPPTVALRPETAAKLKYAGQKQIVQLALSALEQGDGFVLASATGSGKTFTGSAIAKEFIADNPGAKVLFITKNRGLLKSTAEVAKEHFGFEVNLKTPEAAQDGMVHGVSYQGLLNNPIFKDIDWDLVVADEAGEARNWHREENKQGKALMEVMAKSKKGVYSSATPFHSPNEYGYLEKLNLWPKGGFQDWIKNNFAHEKIGDKIVARLDPGKQAKLRQQLIERGQFISQQISYDGFSAHFGVVPVTAEINRSLNRIHEGVARAKAKLMGQGKKGLADRLSAFEATYTKAYLERSRVPEAIQLAKRARAAGWHVLFFSETTAEDLFRRPLDAEDEGGTYRKLDAEMGGELSRIIPPFSNVYEDLKKSFGDEIGDYSGTGNTDAGREAAKDAFMKGDKTMMYTTYAAGGVGVSLHDTDGDKPRLSIFLGPPYSGVLLEQSMGRTWRFGVKSDARAVFLATDSEPDIRLMATKVGPRMRAVRASVLGERDSLGSVMGNYSEEEQQRERQDMLAYVEGDRQKVSAQSFQVRSKRKVNIDNWSAITFPNAREAHNKGMQIEVSGKDGDWSTMYQGKARMYKPPTLAEAVGYKAVDTVADSIAKGENLPPGVQNLEPATKEALAGGSSAVGTEAVDSPVDNYKPAVGKMASEAAFNPGWTLEADGVWRLQADGVPRTPEGPELEKEPADVKTGFWLPGMLSGETMIRSIAKQAGNLDAGIDLVIANRRYTETTDGLYSEYATMLSEIQSATKLDFKDKEIMREVWGVVEGKKTSSNPAINKAAEQLADMHELILEEMAKGGVKLKKPDGSMMPYSEIKPDRNHMPHRIDWQAKLEDPVTKEVHTLEEVMGKTFGEAKRERMIAALAEGTGMTPRQVIDYLNQMKTTPPVMGHIHRARTINFPIYRQDLATEMNYLNQVAHAIATEKVFGSDLGKLNSMIDKIGSANGRTTIKSLFDSHFRPQDWNTGYGKLYNAMAGFEAASKMTWSALKVPFHVFNVPLAMGGDVRPLAKGVLESIFNRKDFAENTTMAGTVIHQLNPMLLIGEGAEHGFVRQIFKKTQFERFYRWGRAVAGSSARVYLEQYAMNDLLKGGDRAEEARRVLKERMLIGDAAIDKAIQTKQWQREDLMTAQRAFANFTMFSDNPLQMPQWARLDTGKDMGIAQGNLHRAIRMTYLLQSFAVKIHSLAKETVYDEVVHHGNYKPLAYLLLAEPILGQMLKATSAAIPSGVHRAVEQGQGKKHQEDRWDRFLESFKALHGDHPAAAALKLYIDGVSAQMALDYLRLMADPLIEMASGQKQKARTEMRYLKTDATEQVIGPAWTSIFYNTLDALTGEASAEMSKDPETARKKNFFHWLTSEVPALREVPYVEEQTKKKPSSAIPMY